MLEGPDAVGKSSMAEMLYRELQAREVSSALFAFPGNRQGSLGHLVYRLHHNPTSEGLCEEPLPSALQALHIAAHLDEIERNILPALKSGRLVILDRYWWSTYVYSLAAGVRREVVNALVAVDKAHFRKINPLVVYLIDRHSPLRPESGNVGHWKKIRAQYLRLLRTETSHADAVKVSNEEPVNQALIRILGDLAERGLIPPSALAAQPEDNGVSSSQTRRLDPTIVGSITPARPSEVYDTYWRFAAERQRVFFRRLLGLPQPWTDDAVLQRNKFTNAYRASDRVSQFLISTVIYRGPQNPQDLFFRIMLFKQFNRIDTWLLLEEELGVITAKGFDIQLFDEALCTARTSGRPIYSPAYIMPSGGRNSRYPSKHRMHLEILSSMLSQDFPNRIADSKNMKEVFQLLRSVPTIGDFLAYQYATDLNYSGLTDFEEMDFVAPGPGARDGIQKCFKDPGGLNDVELIRLMADRQEIEFERLGLSFPDLWGRRLQLIDCQNLFCEVDKYARVHHPEASGRSGRTRIKQRFRPNNGTIQYFYPPKWGINDLVRDGAPSHEDL